MRIPSLVYFHFFFLVKLFPILHLATYMHLRTCDQNASEIAYPLIPNGDQHQISPCNVNGYSTPEFMRIEDMITQGEFS